MKKKQTRRDIEVVRRSSRGFCPYCKFNVCKYGDIVFHYECLRQNAFCCECGKVWIVEYKATKIILIGDKS